MLRLALFIRLYKTRVYLLAMPADPRSAPSAEAARRHFDRWARVYSHSRLLALVQRRAIAELAVRADDRVLDVACGPGFLLEEIAPNVQRAVGADLSEGMLELGRRRLAQPGTDTDVEFHHAPSDALPFADGEFTAVVCTTALHHFPDPERSIDEMARVLAPGGRLVIGDGCRDSPPALIFDVLAKRFEAGHVGLQRKRDLEAMLTRAGLRVTRSRHLRGRVYAFVSAKRPAA